jgi:predicted Zn-dependent protease
MKNKPKYILVLFTLFKLINTSYIHASSRYLRKKIQWQKSTLTYTLMGNVSAYNQTSFDSARQALNDAFHEWQINSCFKFVDVTPNNHMADIKIIFTNDRSNNQNMHDKCDRKFKGSAAHAFFRYHKKFPANIHINNEFFWIESKPLSGTVSLRTVLLHEIGHVLGLFHSDHLDSVMYEYIFTNQIKSITNNDKNDLSNIYSSSSLCKMN